MFHILRCPGSSHSYLCKKTAINIIDSSVYVPFLAVLVLSNVLGFSIQLYTKSLIDQRLMALYNNLIYPFEKGISRNEPIYLFWGSTTGSDQLDHFVPLFNESDFELLPEQDPVETVELEPLDLKFHENMFVQFGRENKVRDCIVRDKPVAGCSKMLDEDPFHYNEVDRLKLRKRKSVSGNILNFVQKLSAYELGHDTSVPYKDVTVVTDHEIDHNELTVHSEMSFEADGDVTDISILSIDDDIELSEL